MSSLIRTDAHPPAERFDFWRHAISDTFVPLEATRSSDEHFEASLASEALGAVQVSDVRSDPHVVRRTRRLIAARDQDFYKVGLQMKGSCVVAQDGRDALLTPGDFAIYDCTRPYTLAFDESFRMLVYMFPRELLRLPAGGVAGLTATRISGQHGLGALVSPFLSRLALDLADYEVTAAERLSDHVLDLLVTLFGDRLSTCPWDIEPQERALLLRIKAFIETHLGDAGLTPNEVARAHHVSVRYLHKLFETQGVTVARWIRQRRLERCRRDLQDPALQEQSISAIAARWGLPEPSHFSRVFKATYGRSPHEHRQAWSRTVHSRPRRLPADGVTVVTPVQAGAG